MHDQELNHFHVYLSDHWYDHAQVRAMVHRLREQNLNVLLDLWHLATGRVYPKELI